MKRLAPVPPPYQPLVWAAGALVGGIAAADLAGGAAWAWLAAALVAGAAWIVLRVRGATARVLLLPCLVAIGAVGGARYRSSVAPPAEDVARLAARGRRIVTLEGTVVRSPRRRSPPADVFLPYVPYYTRTTLALEVRRAKCDGRWRPARGRVRVSVRGEADPKRPVALGDAVHVTGILGGFGHPSNPGEFDAAAYLGRHGVRASLSANHWDGVTVVEPAADPLRWAVGAVRRWALARLDRLPSDEGRAVVAAVMFGRRDRLDLEAELGEDGGVEWAFFASGTSHFLAVSGLHVGLVAAVVLLATRLVGLGPRPTAAGVALVVLAYALATEMKPSVLRAAILVWVLALGWIAGRPPGRINSLAVAVIVVLMLAPGDLFSTGFQLSFGVVLGLFWLAPKVRTSVLRRDPEVDRLLERSGAGGYVVERYLVTTAAISLAAAMISIPLIAHRTHMVAWLAPVGSILLLPLVFGLLASGMVLVAAGWTATWLADLVAPVPDGLARAIGGVARGLATVPGGHVYVPRFGVLWLVLFYGLLAVWVMRERLGITRRRLATAALAALAAYVWMTGPAPARGVRATFLAVGSGNTTLLDLPGGATLLYDAGSSMSHTRAGEGTSARAVWSRGVRRIDAAFISHAHYDHFKDILPLVKRFGIRRVFVPPTFVRRRLRIDGRVIEALRARGVEVRFLGPGDALRGPGEARVTCLWPRGRASQTENLNDGSLVLHVEAGGGAVLLPGDLEAAGMAALAEAGPVPHAEILLWPHHGGDPEATGRLASACGAKVVVISTGARRKPGTRGPPWLAAGGIACYSTAECGMVTVESTPAGPRVATFLTP